MKATGAEILIKLLERQGIETIAGIPGGANLPIYDALRAGSIRHVLARHEQGAGFIAQGMARVSGRAAVCFGTSGPGATNLLTAIADAKLDSIPIVAVTGQVPSTLIGTDAFQEVDTFGLSCPITKHNWMVQDARDLFEIVPRAFILAESGRPGPVLIDIPKNIQLQEVEFSCWPEPGHKENPAAIHPEKIDKLHVLLQHTKRPVLYIGGGIVASGCTEEIIRFARKQNIPVTSTLMGLGAFPPDDPLFLGMLGMHGARFTNMVLDEADLLLAFGVRFDDRATGKVESFCRHAVIAHVDIDQSEINKIKPANLSIEGDIGQTLRQLLPNLQSADRTEWNARVAHLKSEFPFEKASGADFFHPLNLIEQLGALFDPEDILSTDVGQHQMWAAQAYPIRRPRTWLTSGGLGTMGFGLPAAIGAALEKPDRRVLCLTGDGSIMMNIQEFSTLAELGLNVKTVIFNNHHLGLVRQQQQLFYGERYHAVRLNALPDFPALARAFGIPAINLKTEPDPVQAMKTLFEQPGPCVIEAPIPFEENVFPMVPPGAANREMIGHEKPVVVA